MGVSCWNVIKSPEMKSSVLARYQTAHPKIKGAEVDRKTVSKIAN